MDVQDCPYTAQQNLVRRPLPKALCKPSTISLPDNTRLSSRILPLPSAIVEGIPTKRTTTSITTLKPLEQTTRMEQIPTSPTPLARQLFIAADDRVANRTLGLSLERATDVLLPRADPVHQVAVAEGYDALRRAQPGLPALLVDGDARDAFDPRLR